MLKYKNKNRKIKEEIHIIIPMNNNMRGGKK